MHSKEGVTQGDLLTMIAYGIGILPLIRELWGAHPRITQLWYADDAGAGGKFLHILAHLRDLKLRGPTRGYYSELTKSILVEALQNVSRAEEFFHGIGIKVVTGNRYLGGFIGEIKAEKMCLPGKVTGWAESVGTLAGVSRKHPQSLYARLQKSLQRECAFVQQVTPCFGNAFGPVEKALRETFVPELFEGLGEGAPEQGVTRLPVKKAGLALQTQL